MRWSIKIIRTTALARRIMSREPWLYLKKYGVMSNSIYQAVFVAELLLLYSTVGGRGGRMGSKTQVRRHTANVNLPSLEGEGACVVMGNVIFIASDNYLRSSVTT